MFDDSILAKLLAIQKLCTLYREYHAHVHWRLVAIEFVEFVTKPVCLTVFILCVKTVYSKRELGRLLKLSYGLVTLVTGPWPVGGVGAGAHAQSLVVCVPSPDLGPHQHY